jgi:succinate dehydrogenase subunit C
MAHHRIPYTEYHPRWQRRTMSTYWWLERRPYVAFVAREISSVFIAWAVVFLLMLVRAVGQGEEAYRQFLLWATTPAVLLLNVISLAFIVFHAVTWFNLAPAALVVHVRGRKLPGSIITASNYAAFVAACAVIVWLLVW